MKLDTVIIESLSVIKTKTPSKTFEVSPRTHYSLSYRIDGKNVIMAGNKKIISDTGSVTFVPAGVSYTHHVVDPSEQIVAHFTTNSNLGNDIENFTLPLYCEIEVLFHSLYQIWEAEQKESNLHCMATFYNILSVIAKNFQLDSYLKEKTLLDSSVAYMHAHYRESDFNIEMLYNLAHISPAYYRLLFKRVYKCSPIRYLKNLRINYAKQLLKNGYYTVAEISELSGFSTSTYFSCEFKKVVGCMPSQYRKL